jgi:carboxymethylenebutenolidase
MQFPLMNAKTALAVVGVFCVLAAGGCGSRDAGQDESAAPEPGASAVAPDAAPAAPAGRTAVEPGGTVALVEESLAYGEAANTNLVGYLVVPADAVEPLPGLIVIHGEGGLDEETRALTRRLAGERYIALAVDLYAGAAEDGSDAATRAGALVEQSEATLANIHQAYDYLTKYAFVPSVAAIGMGSGGSWALRAGIALPNELDGVVMYYGQILTESAALSQLTAPVLGHFAGLDESVPPADAQFFRVRLREEGKRGEINIYRNVQAGFANPASAAYDAEASDEAWQATVEFLDINL